jgi:poly-gamma-glutamate synthesis protein (capsule biosynthesis protein)
VPDPPQRPPSRTGADRSRSVRLRRVGALLALAAAALVIALGIRAITDDANEPPAFTEAAEQDASAAAETEPLRFTVAASGDLLIHSPVFAVALENGGGDRYDFAPMFEQVKPYVEDADLGICHVETPMTDAEPLGYPVFNTPPDLAKAIASTGWDVCSTASNHALDQGQEGIASTIETLNRAGVEHAGTAASRAQAEEPTIVEVEGVKVALLAYTEMTNGVPLPKPYSVELAKTREILDDARAAREAGAEVVIVNLHAGDEYQPQPSKSQKQLAQALTRSDDVTAVIGQHVHIVQPIEEVNGKPVVYGEGNLISNQDVACCPEASQDGLIALLDFVVDEEGARVERTRYVPTFVGRPDYTVFPVGDALEGGDYDASALRASYERTVDVAGTGAAKPVPPRLP